MIKWGVIGTGKIASKFTSEFAHIKDAYVHAIASRDLVNAETFAKKHTIVKYYGDYDSLLKDPEIDAVYIATPHASHCQYTLAALEHEKAVLCEKPMGMTFHEVRAMTEMAANKHLLLMEGLWTAFLPQFLYLQHHLTEETFGMLRSVEADFGFPADPNPNSRLLNKTLGGGSLLDIGIYPVFLALSTLGVPHEIKASAEFFETGVDKNCSIHFKYANGANAHLLSSFVSHTPTEAVLIFDKLSLKIHGRFHEPSQIALVEKGRKTIKKFPTKGLGYHYEIAHFNELLKQGKTESPIMSFKTSLALAQLLDEIRFKIGLLY
jgi:predicted dehydrogenase